MPSEDETIILDEEIIETPADDTPPEPPAPVPLTEAEKLEIAREYVQNKPEEFSHYYTTPTPKLEQPTLPIAPTPDPVAQITDEFGNVDGAKLAAFLADRDKKNSETLMQSMTGLLAPVMQGFATQTAIQGLPEAAVPFAQQIAADLGVPLYQAANDPKTMDFVRSAAIGKAYQAGKLTVTMPEGAEPVGGGSRTSFTDSQMEGLRAYSKIIGRQPTAKEAEELRKDGLI